MEEAVACHRQALDVDPGYLEARLALATALSRLRRDDEALAEFQSALAGEPGNSEAHIGCGVLLDRKRSYAEAIEHFRAALARDPDHVVALEGLATSLKNAGQQAEALATARRVLALRPDFPPALSLVGSILVEIGSVDEGLSFCRRALSLAPGYLPLAYELVQLAKVQRGDPALRVLEEALPRVGSLPSHEQLLLHFGLAKAYDDIGERDPGICPSPPRQRDQARRSEIRGGDHRRRDGPAFPNIHPGAHGCA